MKRPNINSTILLVLVDCSLTVNPTDSDEDANDEFV